MNSTPYDKQLCNSMQQTHASSNSRTAQKWRHITSQVISARKVEKSEIEVNKSSTNTSITTKHDMPSSYRESQERFVESNGLVIIENNGLSIKHVDDDHKCIYFRGGKLYHEGCHQVTFRIVQGIGSLNNFIGIASSEISLRLLMFHLTAVVGWFNNEDGWQHGKTIRRTKFEDSKDDEIKTNDIIQLKMDCDNKRIELFHERTNKHHVMMVDSRKTPLPWKILLAFHRKNDCIKILTST